MSTDYKPVRVDLDEVANNLFGKDPSRQYRLGDCNRVLVPYPKQSGVIRSTLEAKT